MNKPNQSTFRLSKWAYFGAFVVVSVIGCFWFMVRYDPPRTYMLSNPNDSGDVERLIIKLEENIKRYQEDISIYGKSSYVLDADRYWPMDMDTTVLAIQRYRLIHNRLPDSWKELIGSKVLDDKTVIHSNWVFIVSDEDWQIELPDEWLIGRGN